MQIYLIPMHKFIGVNNLDEVSDPTFFEKGFVPTARGLLSTEIFGITQRERQETFAYINLHGTYLAPFVYKMLRRMNRSFEDVVNGSKKFRIDDKGQLVEDPEKGQTGVDFLYKNWDKLKFTRNDSNIRNERIDLLETHTKDHLFVKFWDVIPAFYRDVNLQSQTGNPSKHEINDLYARLIRMASTVRDGAMFDFSLYAVQARIQNTLVEIYDIIKTRIEKKHGLIRKSLLGKSIDYGSRLVISAPDLSSNSLEDETVDFYNAGVPLAHCCSLFTPFIVGWVTNYFRQTLEQTGNKFPIYDKEGKLKYTVELEEPAVAFSEEVIKKALDRFVKSPANRFDIIYLPVKESSMPVKGKKYPMVMAGRNAAIGDPEDKSPLMQRPLTWTDIFYQAAVDVTSDKMVWVTRYPLLDYFG